MIGSRQRARTTVLVGTIVLLLLTVPLTGRVVASGAVGSVSDTTAMDRENVTITEMTVTGNDTLADNETKRFWLGSAINVSVTVADADDRAWVYDVCALVDGNSSCRSLTVKNESKSVQLNWATNVPTGRHDLVVTVNNTVFGSSEQADRKTIPITVIDPAADIDGDGLDNRREYDLGLNMTNPDTDGDGLGDGEEVTTYRTDPLVNDTDRDGLDDETEVTGPTNATDPDTDGDGLEDGLEREAGLDPTSRDTDNDTLLDEREYEGPTDPTLADTDDDGLDDDVEIAGPTNATDSDTDGDGVSDGRERELGLNATNPDTDGDYLRDGLELTAGTNPDSAVQTLALGFVILLVVGLVSVVVPAQLLRRVRASDTDSTDDPDAPAAAETEVVETTPESEAAAEQPTSSEPDPELLPPDERLEQLLGSENGRMRQSELVDETDWSKAKVSRTLSEMEDDGTVTRYRLGRENVVKLSEQETADHLGPSSK